MTEKKESSFDAKLEQLNKEISGKEKILQESIVSRGDIMKQVEARKKLFEQSMGRAYSRTDSGRPGAKIEDYAGIDAEGNERGNLTRDTLAGYLAALELSDPLAANLAYEKAAKLYEESDSGWLSVDKLLSHEHLMRDMGMREYADQLEKYKLQSSALGYAIGCLHFADRNMDRALRERYKEYFFSALDKLNLQERVTEEYIQIPAGGSPYAPPMMAPVRARFSKKLTPKEQEAMLSAIKTPKEFLDEQKNAEKVFDILVEQAKQLQVFFEFKFENEKINSFLAKKRPDVSAENLEEFEEVRKLILAEVVSRLAAKKKEQEKALGLQLIRARNLFGTAGIPEEIKKRLNTVKETIEKAVTTLNEITIDEKASYGDLTDYSKKFREVMELIAHVTTENFNIEKAILELPGSEEESEGLEGAEAAGAGSSTGNEGIESIPAVGGAPKEWTGAELVSSRFIRPKLKVSPHITYSAYRNNEGVIIGKLKAGESLTIVDINAKGKKFDGAVFINVKLPNGTEVWADEAVLEYDPSELAAVYGGKKQKEETPVTGDSEIETEEGESEKERRPREDKSKGKGSKGKESEAERSSASKETAPTLRRSPYPLTEAYREHNTKTALENTYAFLRPVNLMYVWVLDRVARYGNSPDGVTFYFDYAGGRIRPRLRMEGPNKYVLHTVEGDITYKSLYEVLSDINNGHLSRQLTELHMRKKENYEPYKSNIGRVKVIEGSGRKGQFHMELDWRNPNADVYFTVRPHGIITFRVHRKNAGVYGEAERLGTAGSFNDFMIQLGHIRSWAEARKHGRTETPAARREIECGAIADIYSFLREEGKIGRVVAYKINRDRSLHMALDWGGGNKEFSPSNARARIDVDANGMLVMSVNGHGVNTLHERFYNHTDLIRRLWDLRTWALRAYNFENRSV